MERMEQIESFGGLRDLHKYQVAGSSAYTVFWMKAGENILDRFKAAWDDWRERTGYSGSIGYINVVYYSHDDIFQFRIHKFPLESGKSFRSGRRP